MAISLTPCFPSRVAAHDAKASAPIGRNTLGPYAFTQDFLRPLDELVQAALAEGAQNWQATVPLVDDWTLHTYEVVPLSDGKRAITVYLQAVAHVAYRTVEVSPPRTAQVVTVRHQSPRPSDPTAGLAQACDTATAAARQNAPLGIAVDGALTGEAQWVATSGIWPFYFDTYAQLCTQSYRTADACLEMTDHPKSCAYCCQDAEITMAQEIACELIGRLWSCTQINVDAITPPLANCLASLLNHRGET